MKLQQSVLYSATLQHNFSTDPTKDCLQNQCPCFGCNGSFFCRRKNLKSLRNRLKWTSGQFRILPPAKQERSIKDVAFRISMFHFHDLAISGILKFPAFFCLAATMGDLRFSRMSLRVCERKLGEKGWEERGYAKPSKQ